MKRLILVLVFLILASATYAQRTSTLSFSDTCAVDIDTLSRHIGTTSNSLKKTSTTGLVNQNYTYTIWADDSLEVSYTIGFTESFVIYPNYSYTTPIPLNVNFKNNVYFRRKGTVGTVNFMVMLIGD